MEKSWSVLSLFIAKINHEKTFKGCMMINQSVVRKKNMKCYKKATTLLFIYRYKKGSSGAHRDKTLSRFFRSD